MKTDFVTAIIAAIIGVALSYFLVGEFLLKDPDSIIIKNIETINAGVNEPNPEVFNYRALNPTVETYIDCTNYDLSGNCLEKQPENSEEE